MIWNVWPRAPRAATPVRVALIGAEIRHDDPQPVAPVLIELAVLADISNDRALRPRHAAAGSASARRRRSGRASDVARSGRTALVTDGELATADVDIVIEATGSVEAGALRLSRDRGVHDSSW